MIDLIDYIERCSSRKSTYRLADFFNRWWDEYAQHPAEYITPEQYKAVNAIRVCRTVALGIDTYVCPIAGRCGKSVIAARTVFARHAAGVIR